MIEDYQDRMAGLDPEWRPTPYRRVGFLPFLAPPGGDVKFSEQHNAYYVDHRGARLWWSYDIEGKRGWQSVIRTERGEPRARQDAIAYREATARSSRMPRSDER